MPLRPDNQDDEQTFLEAYDPAQWPRPSVAVDVALVSVREGQLVVLMRRRGEPPHAGRWSLPGGFCRLEESLDEAAGRVLAEKAGLAEVYVFKQPSAV